MPGNGAGAPATPGGGGGDQPAPTVSKGGGGGGAGPGAAGEAVGRRREADVRRPLVMTGTGTEVTISRYRRVPRPLSTLCSPVGRILCPSTGPANLDIVGRDEAAPVQQCSGLGAAHQAHQRPRACSRWRSGCLRVAVTSGRA